MSQGFDMRRRNRYSKKRKQIEIARRGGGEELKIEINVDEKETELKIKVTCNRLTPEIEKLLASLRMMDKKLTARKNGEICFFWTLTKLYILKQ